MKSPEQYTRSNDSETPINSKKMKVERTPDEDDCFVGEGELTTRYLELLDLKNVGQFKVSFKCFQLLKTH